MGALRSAISRWSVVNGPIVGFKTHSISQQPKVNNMYGNGQAPIFILKEGTQRTRGRSAQSNNIAAAKAVADSVRSTLGPKGMDKMLVDSMGDVVITNDGATILKEMDIEHPAAKMIIEVAKTRTLLECLPASSLASLAFSLSPFFLLDVQVEPPQALRLLPRSSPPRMW